MKCLVDGTPPGENQLEIYPGNAFQLTYTVLRRVVTANDAVTDTASLAVPILGPMYWAGAVPCGMINASMHTGVKPISEADASTQADVNTLRGADAREYTSQGCRNGPCTFEHCHVCVCLSDVTPAIHGGAVCPLLLRLPTYCGQHAFLPSSRFVSPGLEPCA
jgi:hypothetical protein